MTSAVRFDIAVVGGGIAGISIAAEIAAYRTVVVVERESTLTHHTTGRSAAAFLESYGGADVRALTSASRPLFEPGVDETPLLTPRPLLWIVQTNARCSLDAFARHRPSLHILDPSGVVEACPVIRREAVQAGALDASGFDIDVMSLHQRYVRRLRERHGVIRPSVGEVRAERRGRWWEIETGEGVVCADVVVNAAGAWADAVAAASGVPTVGLQPLRRTLAVGRPSSTQRHAELPFVFDLEEAFYFRPEGPNVLISPAEESLSEPCDARADELDVAIAIERVNEVSTLGIQSILSAWAGLRTFAPDRNPVVGFDPAADGFFWFAGQGGYGIQMAPALAELGAALATGSPPPAWLGPSGVSLERIDVRRLVDKEQPTPHRVREEAL